MAFDRRKRPCGEAEALGLMLGKTEKLVGVLKLAKTNS